MPPTTITAEGATPLPYDPQRTAISQEYREPGMIADRVLPRTHRLGSRKFSYQRWRKADAFIVPDTRLGRVGKPAQVEFEAEKVTDETEDHGLCDYVPQADVDAASNSAMRQPEESDPLDNATVMLTHLMLLAREVRVANAVFAPASYDATLRSALGVGSRFDEGNTDVIEAIDDALQLPIVRPNVAVMGQQVWVALRRHPDVLKAIHMGEGDKGLASRRAVAELFELDEILVGRSRVASNVEGQDLALKRAWGKSMALIYRGGPAGGTEGSEGVGMAPDTRTPTFGFTASYVDMEMRTAFRADRGVRGAHMVAVLESSKEVICGGDAFGYLFANAVS